MNCLTVWLPSSRLRMGISSTQTSCGKVAETSAARPTGETPMTIGNWKTQVYGCVQSLLFNNPHRVIRYRVRDEQGNWVERGDRPAPVRRLYETEAPPERTCL